MKIFFRTAAVLALLLPAGFAHGKGKGDQGQQDQSDQKVQKSQTIQEMPNVIIIRVQNDHRGQASQATAFLVKSPVEVQDARTASLANAQVGAQDSGQIDLTQQPEADVPDLVENYFEVLSKVADGEETEIRHYWWRYYPYGRFGFYGYGYYPYYGYYPSLAYYYRPYYGFYYGNYLYPYYASSYWYRRGPYTYFYYNSPYWRW